MILKKKITLGMQSVIIWINAGNVPIIGMESEISAPGSNPGLIFGFHFRIFILGKGMNLSLSPVMG